jgi:hypothetical protein
MARRRPKGVGEVLIVSDVSRMVSMHEAPCGGVQYAAVWLAYLWRASLPRRFWASRGAP